MNSFRRSLTKIKRKKRRSKSIPGDPESQEQKDGSQKVALQQTAESVVHSDPLESEDGPNYNSGGKGALTEIKPPTRKKKGPEDRAGRSTDS
jgi:hypothetical protein